MDKIKEVSCAATFSPPPLVGGVVGELPDMHMHHFSPSQHSHEEVSVARIKSNEIADLNNCVKGNQKLMECFIENEHPPPGGRRRPGETGGI